MEKRHFTRSDTTPKSAAHHEVKSLAELSYKGIEVRLHAVFSSLENG